MKVKNINGTSPNKCKCGSWLSHWTKYSGQLKPFFCPVINCSNTDLVGAHVKKDSRFDMNWYIVPLCHKHNAQTPELEIDNYIRLVSANKSETCER